MGGRDDETRGMNLKKLMCWIWGHDRMQTGARKRVCLRCGQREKLQQYGRILGWEELPDTAH
jgi:hypothetical protein